MYENQLKDVKNSRMVYLKPKFSLTFLKGLNLSPLFNVTMQIALQTDNTSVVFSHKCLGIIESFSIASW